MTEPGDVPGAVVAFPRSRRRGPMSTGHRIVVDRSMPLAPDGVVDGARR